MVVAIMQPYFFPYIGYFQLMQAVDCFVFYDDAQYMKGGWINRNRILREGAPAWWTRPIVRDSYRLPISQRRYSDAISDKESLLGQLDGAYRKAPQFSAVMPALRHWMHELDTCVADFNKKTLTSMARMFGVKCDFRVSSEFPQTAHLKGQDRVISICQQLGATHYLNASGGRHLYDSDAFNQAGIELSFTSSLQTQYPQFSNKHVPFLSIVDVMMFNDPYQISGLLNQYKVLAASEICSK